MVNKWSHILYAIIFFLFFPALCNGQNTIIFNPFHDHYIINKGSIAPSAYLPGVSSASVYFKNRTGLLSDVKDFYTDAIIHKEKQQTLGIKLYGEQETSLFTKTKGQVVYAYHTHLKHDITWSIGTAFGFANIGFKSTPAGIGGQGWTWDMSLSSSLQWKKFFFDVALQQIPNNTIQPIGYEFLLLRYLDLILSYHISINEKILWKTSFNIKHNQLLTLWSTDNQLSFQKKYGILFRYGKENALSTGLWSILPFISEQLQLTLSYSNFFRQENLKYQSISLGVRYVL